MAVTDAKILADPTILTGLLRTFPLDEFFMWDEFVVTDSISGTKWKSRTRFDRAVMSALLDHGAHLPRGLKGIVTEREGDMIKTGLSLPIDPEEVIELQRQGRLGQEITELMGTIARSIFSALEWCIVRGNFGLSLTLDGGATQDVGSLLFQDTVTTSWSTVATATGVADLVAANDQIRDACQGFSSSRIIMSYQQWTYLRDQAATQELVFGTAGSGTQVNNGQLQTLLTTMGLPPVRIYDGTVEQKDSTEAAFYAENRVVDEDILLLMPPVEKFPNGFGRLIYGETSDQILAMDDGLVPNNLGGGIYGFSQKYQDPGRIELKGQLAFGLDLESLGYQGTLETTQAA